MIISVDISVFNHLFIYLLNLSVEISETFPSEHPLCIHLHCVYTHTHMLGQNCALATFPSIVSPHLFVQLERHAGSIFVFTHLSHLQLPLPPVSSVLHIHAGSNCVFVRCLSSHSETDLHGLDAHC